MIRVKRSLQQRNKPLRIFAGKVLEQTVERCFAGKERYLSLYAQHQRPLYVLETLVLQRRAEEFRAAFSACLEDTGYYFAVKSNNHPAVARTLLQTGYGLDVSSGMELEMALELGAAAIVFSGPGKTAAELTLALQHFEKVTLLADSLREVEKISLLARQRGVTAKVGIRLTTGTDALWRKFGIPQEQLPAFWQAVQAMPGVDFCGLQFHTSWNLTAGATVAFIEQLGKTLQSMPCEFIARLRFLDLGGGIWPPQGEWLQRAATLQGKIDQSFKETTVNSWRRHFCAPAVPIAEYAGAVAAALYQHVFPLLRCKVCFEPGRWICNDALQLVMGVVDKKAADLVITDAGINAIGWDRFETDYFPVLNLSRPALVEKPCHILGCLCTPHDVWGYSYWGSDIQEGDILMLPMQGAYSFSLRQHFIKPLPEFIVV